MNDVRPSRRWHRFAPDAPFLVLTAIAAVALLFLARSMTFWQDEWSSIGFDGELLDVVRPVNEHWQTIPLVLYRTTFAIVGLHSYLPYIAQVIALHLLAVGGAYVLCRNRVGPVVAAAACVPLLFLGSGSENLFWAFQTGFVGSVAFGMWALVLVERTGRASAAGTALLLIASLMSSGMGLFFVATALGRTLLDDDLRRRALATIPPIAVYLVWYLTVGQEGVTRSSSLASVPGFVIRGIGHAVGAFTGWELVAGGVALSVAVFAVAVLMAGWSVVASRPPRALAAGCLLALGAMYTVIGLVRADLESDFATRSRYVYVASFLLVLAAVDLLPLLRSWTSGRSRLRLGLRALLSIVLVAAIAANLTALEAIRKRFQGNADLTRAYIALALDHRGEDWIDPASVLPEMPALPELIVTVERFGSPLRDDLVPGVATDPGAGAHEAALLRMVGSGFRAERGHGDVTPIDLRVIGALDPRVHKEGGCLALTARERKAAVAIEMPTGSRVRLTATSGVSARAVLGHSLPPSRGIDVVLVAGLPLDIVVPDIGDRAVWSLRIEVPPSAATLSICGIGRAAAG
jgi:hypothetical protein